MHKSDNSVHNSREFNFSMEGNFKLSLFQWHHIKLRSHMRGAVAEWRRADFDIPTLPLRVCSHIRGADAGGSAISWGQKWFGARGFEAHAENWVLDPFVAERILLPLRLHSTTTYVWTHVMICVEANFLPDSAHVRSAHVWTYLKAWWFDLYHIGDMLPQFALNLANSFFQVQPYKPGVSINMILSHYSNIKDISCCFTQIVNIVMKKWSVSEYFAH